MTQEEKLYWEVEDAYNDVVNSLFSLVNAITQQRDYYRTKCVNRDKD